MARLHHPNIVQIYDIGECDGCPYFTMELVERPDPGPGLPGPAAAGPGGRHAGRRPWPAPSPAPTSKGSSTATSSRPTSCSSRRCTHGAS